MPRRHRVPSPVLVLLLAVTAAAAGARAATVTLPAKAPAERSVDLQEVWRIDGDSEDVLLGIISGAVRGADGRVYLLDRQLSQVVVMAPDGEYLTTLGRQGEGPGELNRPHSLYLARDGEGDDVQVGVIQGFPGKITLINGDGTPGGEITVGGAAEDGGFKFVREIHPCGDHLVGVYGRATFDMEKGTNSMTQTLAVMDSQGATERELLDTSREAELGRPVFDERAQFSEISTWTAGPDGSIYTVPDRDAWRINVRDLQGDVVRVLERPFEARKRTDEDKEELTADMVVVMNGRRQEVENKALDMDPPISGLYTPPDGRLFVRNCWQAREQLPEGVAARYDVIDPDGRFVEELTLRLPGFDNEADLLIFLDAEHYVLVKNYDSAARSLFAPPAGDEDEAADADLGEAEPLSVVYLRVS